MAGQSAGQRIGSSDLEGICLQQQAFGRSVRSRFPLQYFEQRSARVGFHHVVATNLGGAGQGDKAEGKLFSWF